MARRLDDVRLAVLMLDCIELKRRTNVVALLEDGTIDPWPVLTHDLGMDEAATGYVTMATRQEGTVKVAVSPNG